MAYYNCIIITVSIVGHDLGHTRLVPKDQNINQVMFNMKINGTMANKQNICYFSKKNRKHQHKPKIHRTIK